MDSIVGSLRLGWDALLLKEGAYEKMRADASPVVKGLVLIVIVGVAIALLGLVGDILEWASTPDLNEVRDTVFRYITQMPWWDEAARDPGFTDAFDWFWNTNWNAATWLSPSPGGAVADILLTPLGLIIRWLIYGVLAYLFAIWLGGTANLSETLGVLSLAVAPQILNALTVFPGVSVGSAVSVWAILCAFVGLKVAHKLSWQRAVWATLLPFILFIVVVLLAGCFASTIIALVAKGGW
ncbi:MAG: YIP1 family protein [Anaerolineae bacterium]|jgi:hypothetical protein